MESSISAYLWGYKNIVAGDKTFEKFRKLYPNSDLFCRVDIDGDIEGYSKLSKKWNVDFSINSIKVGYCGNFEASNHNIGRDGWPKENAFEWLNGIYEACLKTSSKYMIILEEDVFVLDNISIIKSNFGAAIVKTNNPIPISILEFIKSLNGNITDTEYGCCGGAIINTKAFIIGWEISKNSLWERYDEIFKKTKLIGWADCLLQVIIQCSSERIIVNNELVEPWMLDHGWVNKDWREFEIVNYLKDIEIIKSL